LEFFLGVQGFYKYKHDLNTKLLNIFLQILLDFLIFLKRILNFLSFFWIFVDILDFFICFGFFGFFGGVYEYFFESTTPRATLNY